MTNQLQEPRQSLVDTIRNIWSRRDRVEFGMGLATLGTGYQSFAHSVDIVTDAVMNKTPTALFDVPLYVVFGVVSMKLFTEFMEKAARPSYEATKAEAPALYSGSGAPNQTQAR